MNDHIKQQLAILENDLKQPVPKQLATIIDEVQKGAATFVEISFIAPNDPFKTEVPKMEFKFRRSGSPALLVLECEWLASIEEELYRLNLQVQTQEQEAMRGGTLLLSNLRAADIIWGKGFVDSVLWVVIEERFKGLELFKTLKEEYSTSAKPYESTHLYECKNYLQSCINGFGNSLVFQLKYDDKIAYRILVGAVVYMLDKRFNISLRKTLFPNRH